MPRTAIAKQTVVKNSGASVTYVAADATNGNSFPNDGKTRLLVRTGSLATQVTVHSVPCSHGRTQDTVVAIGNNSEAYLGPFDPELFNQVGDPANVYVDYTVGTNVTVAAVGAA